VGSTSADLVDSLLGAATPVKSGYSFTYSAGTAANNVISTYTLNADPVNSSTGQRHFFTDQSGVIRATTAAQSAALTDPPIGN
jgi:hypothetical protein